MVGYTDYMATRVLNNLVLKSSYVVPGGAPWLALFTATGTDAGTGFTEVSTGGTAYGRVAATGATWNSAAAGGAAASTISNASPIAFAQATGSWGNVIAWGLYDASTVGSLLFWDYMGNNNWLPFTCTNASPGIVTCAASGFVNGNTAVVTAEYGGSLPTGLAAGTQYTIANVSGADNFSFSTNTTSTGNGLTRLIAPQTITGGVTASFAAGTLVLSQA